MYLAEPFGYLGDFLLKAEGRLAILDGLRTLGQFCEGWLCGFFEVFEWAEVGDVGGRENVGAGLIVMELALVYS